MAGRHETVPADRTTCGAWGASRYGPALSAGMDGEQVNASPRALLRHLDRCPGCTAWLGGASRVAGAVRSAPPAPVPDLVGDVLTAAQPLLPRSRRTTRIRVALAAVGLVQALLAWSAAVAGEDPLTGMVHTAGETSAWNLALAVALLGAAARPAGDDDRDQEGGVDLSPMARRPLDTFHPRPSGRLSLSDPLLLRLLVVGC